eukprot:1187852-Prymnesium_polylepis.1
MTATRTRAGEECLMREFARLWRSTPASRRQRGLGTRTPGCAPSRTSALAKPRPCRISTPGALAGCGPAR